ncbi:DUF6350 family protein [uncultured Jatrophihabitans sp.]|uniref:cell division protein PerM n=1 Tax=uncultured Jatrophihabitans sp. TaxID=1610747 RepID=UPI0035CA9BA6
MPAGPSDDDTRRSVVPPAAARSLWVSAVWTGAGAALVAAVVAIVSVAICWLPAAGQAGSAGSAIRAGLITFLAATRGGITVDGVDSAFLPLGLTVALGVIAWRAGCGLADAADDLAEYDPVRLIRAGLLQAAAFAATCAVLAVVSSLGTSSVPPVGAFLGGFVLFAITGGAALLRYSPLREAWAETRPAWLLPATRVVVAVLAVYLAAGALLVVGSLIVHHAEVEQLSHQVGGGWSGIPVLLLGLLAAPNAAIAGAAYLAGPGFAVGDGTTVALGSTPRGTLPSFPVLGAVPHGPAGWIGWLLAVLTGLAAGAYASALARRCPDPWRTLGRASLGIAFAGVVLAWQGGGAIGSGRLHAVGASPWQFGLALGAVSGLAAAAVLGLQLVGDSLRTREAEDPDHIPLAAAGARVSDAVGNAVTHVSARATDVVSGAASAVVAVVRRDSDPDSDTDGEHGINTDSEHVDGGKGGKLAG